MPDKKVSKNSFQVELNDCSLVGPVPGQSVTRCLWSVVYIDAHDRFHSTRVVSFQWHFPGEKEHVRARFIV